MADKKKSKMAEEIAIQVADMEHPTYVVRGDLSDSDWEDLKKEASNGQAQQPPPPSRRAFKQADLEDMLDGKEDPSPSGHDKADIEALRGVDRASALNQLAGGVKANGYTAERVGKVPTKPMDLTASRPPPEYTEGLPPEPDTGFMESVVKPAASTIGKAAMAGAAATFPALWATGDAQRHIGNAAEALKPPVETQPDPQQVAFGKDGVLPNEAQDPVTGAPTPAVDPRAAEMAKLQATIDQVGPVGFKPEEVDPSLVERQKAALDEAKARADAAQVQVADSVARQDQLLLETQAKVLEHQADAEKLANLAAEAKRNSVVEAERVNTAASATLDEIRRASATAIDPHRYWNDKGIGGQVAGLIAAALFGFSGKGMEWLQRVDSLVEQDNRLQASDRASKVAGLEKKYQGQRDAVAFAMQKGATLAEANLIAKAGKYEAIKAQLDMYQLNSNNAQAKQRAAEMSVGLAQKVANAMNEAVGLGVQVANSKNTAMYHQASLALESKKIRASLAIAAMKKSGAGEPLPAAEANKLNNTVRLIAELDNMARHTPRSGLPQPLQSASLVGQEMFNVDGQQAEGNAYESSRTNAIKLAAESALQKHEIEAFGSKLPGRKGLYSTQGQLKALRENTIQNLKASLEGYAASGQDVSRYNALIQKLEQQNTMPGSDAPPSYAKPK